MSIERREFLKKVMALGVGTGLSSLAPGCSALKSSSTNRRPPNLVYIMPDEHPQRSWSLGGTSQLHTPNFERLARQGLTFNNCVSNNPICVPHRAIQLTGLHSHQNGIRWNSGTCTNTGYSGLHPSNPSWSQQLKNQGYKMGYVGKWHLYGLEEDTFYDADGKPKKDKQVPPGPGRFGFDDLWAERILLEKEHRTKGYYDENHHLVHWGDYPPAGMFKTTMDFIEKNQNEPFAVVCCPDLPHPPYSKPAPPKKWLDFYKQRLGEKGEKTEFRPNVPADKINDRLGRWHLYCYAQISALDELVGQLMDKLEQLGIADNTILIYTSDHGDLMQCHGEIWKRWPWDESILVPFIASCPNLIPPGRSTDIPFSSIDIAPTLLGLCGTDIPSPMQGMNLTPFLQNDPCPVPEYAPIMYIRPPEGNYMTEKMPQLVDYRGVRTDRYTYTRRRDPAGQPDGRITPWHLYDNQKDPYQLKNLINDPAYRDVQTSLNKMTDQWLEKVGESFSLSEQTVETGEPRTPTQA